MTEANSSRTGRFSVERHYYHFAAGVLTTVLFPLLPLFIEWKFSDAISSQTILISAIMYCVAIAITSENIFIFISGFLVAIFAAIPFGILLQRPQAVPLSMLENMTEDQVEILTALSIGTPKEDVASVGFAGFAIFVFAVIQFMKCFDSHVTQRQNFIYFPRSS